MFGYQEIFDKTVDSVKAALPAAIITFGAGHPFDRVKTLMQANPNISSGYLVSKEMFAQTGIKGFYTAGIPNSVRHIMKYAYRTPLEGGLERLYAETLPEPYNTKSTRKTAAGLSMAMADTMIIMPLERLKVWLMTQRAESSASLTNFFMNRSNNHPSLLQDLYKGGVISLMRSSASWVSYLVAESKIREWVIQHSPRIDEKAKKVQIPLAEKLLIGSLGGIINGLCTLPLDTIKTHMQKAGQLDEATLANMYSEAKKLVGKHGIARGLYPAFLVRLLHYSIVGVITSPLIQKAEEIWQSPSPIK